MLPDIAVTDRVRYSSTFSGDAGDRCARADIEAVTGMPTVTPLKDGTVSRVTWIEWAGVLPTVSPSLSWWVD